MLLTLYLSPGGDDSLSGLSLTRSSSGQGPLATLRQARDRVRAARRSGHVGPVRVELAGGVYFLDEPFTLEPQDSGTPDAPVVYAAVPGEQPVVSGGVPIGNWQPTTIHGRDAWVAHLPQGLTFTQLFVNGQRAKPARYPKQGFLRISGTPDNFTQETYDWQRPCHRFHYHEGDVDPRWRNPAAIRMVTVKRWFDIHAKPTHLDADQRIVTLDSSFIGGPVDSDGQFARYWLENVYEHLSEQGEFYIDPDARQVYYLPRFADKIDTAQVIAPQLDRLLRLEGEPFGKPVAHVRFEGLTFQHAEYRYEPGHPGGVQAAYTLPGAITLRGAHHCVFYACTVSQVGPYAIEFRLGCTRNDVIACHLHDLGGGGVKINHDRGDATPYHDAAVRLRSEPQFGVHVETHENPDALSRQAVTVSDCRIHDAGLIYPSSVGIWIGDSAGNRILHNELFNLGYSGVSTGWTWVYEYDTRAAQNLIEGNHIHHLNQAGLLSDLAGIYTLGPAPGTVLRGNLIHDVHTAHYGNWGIYHDGSSSYHYDEFNAAFRCAYGAFFTNAGRQNLLHRNILINDNSPDNPAVVIGHDGGLLTATLTENLIVSPAPQVLLHDHWQGHARFERNIYANALGAFGFVTRPFQGQMFTLERWHDSGMACDETLATAAPTGLASGALCIPRAATFIDDTWQQVLDRLHTVGPRPQATCPPDYDHWPHLPRPAPQPAVMPVFDLDLPMYTHEKRDEQVPRFELEPGATLTGRLIFINRGEAAYHGRAALTLSPQVPHGPAATFDDTPLDLPPGTRTERRFTLTMGDADHRYLLHITANTPGVHPSGMFIYRKHP